MGIKKSKVTAIIVAGGQGGRMETDVPKQFLEVMGKPIIAYTINSLSKCNDINDIIIVTLPNYIMYCKDLVDEFNFNKVTKIVAGGSTRQMSVYNGLKELDKDTEFVAIHDGARPLIDPVTTSCCIKAAKYNGCAAVGVKMKDTIKVVDDNQMIEYTANREKLWQIQTPQIFKKDIILQLHKNGDGTATDDCILAEKAGYKVKIVEGKYENIKITTPQDMYIMKGLLEE